MAINVQVIFYSMYAHIYQMAEAIAAGAREVDGVGCKLYRVPDLMTPEALEAAGAGAAQASFAHIPVATVEQLADADAVIFGTPTRFGNMCAQMKQYIDQAGSIWMSGGLVGKAGSVFASTGTQHGGQETTITSFHTILFHLGMVVVGVPYSESRLVEMGEITGGTPYGATTMANLDGSRQPTENELAIARFQGAHVARIAAKLQG